MMAKGPHPFATFCANPHSHNYPGVEEIAPWQFLDDINITPEKVGGHLLVE